jgi:hypothetical protein
VSFYDFLLLVHVLGAFALVAAFVAFWTIYLVTARLDADSTQLNWAAMGWDLEER